MLCSGKILVFSLFTNVLWTWHELASERTMIQHPFPANMVKNCLREVAQYASVYNDVTCGYHMNLTRALNKVISFARSAIYNL